AFLLALGAPAPPVRLAGGMGVEVRHEQQAGDVGAAVAQPPQQVAHGVGDVQEHAAAGAPMSPVTTKTRGRWPRTPRPVFSAAALRLPGSRQASSSSWRRRWMVR